MSACPCGSEQEFDQCCGPLISGKQAAATAEALMRSRYSAYVVDAIGYLGETLHPSHRSDYDEQSTRRWAEKSDWLGLEVRSTEDGGENDDQGVVEFVAHFKEKGVVRSHHEYSRFSRHNGRWYYVDGKLATPETVVNTQPKVGRNDPCPCGSGKKYKKCCGS